MIHADPIPLTDPVAAEERFGPDGLQPIEKRYIWVLRAALGTQILFWLLAAALAEYFLHHRFGLAFGAFALPIALIGILMMAIVPSRRIANWGYQISADHIRAAHGFLFRIDTVVPFVRVQHIDVKQGPLERTLGLARLTMHTSGALNESITIPGLEADHAAAMRETIRRQILTDFE
ncbi:MAG TPA: PH domain-containing protein [Sphingopyxis sp.]|nr:PH domain-containing protein [Sphingopyxis sp.]